jgi:hypothetical protein
MKVISWPTPTSLGVAETNTAVGTWSCHRVHISNLVAEALRKTVALSPVGGQCIPADIAEAVSGLYPALTVGSETRVITIDVSRTIDIMVASVLFLFVCIFSFSPFCLRAKANSKVRNDLAHKPPLLTIIPYKRDWQVATVDKKLKKWTNVQNKQQFEQKNNLLFTLKN